MRLSCTRAGTWDLGALQHSLGDCVSSPPPKAGPSSVGDAGASSSGGDGGASSSGDGGTNPGGDGSSRGSSTAPDGSSSDEGSAADDGGCGCRATPATHSPALALAGIAVAGALARYRRRRS